jgi:DNA adenine methylase
MDEKSLVEEAKIDCKPFLRWAGGKTWLKKHLSNLLPENGFNDYHEPFLGGGSVFFHLQPENSYLSDFNPNLIDVYNELKENVDGVIEELLKFKNTEEFYYSIRQKNFKTISKRAAQFIFLNQTSFNGIYRVNLKGVYNVPYGHRTKEFCEAENLRLVSKALRNTNLNSYSFSETIENVKHNDLVFLDPPYTVTHNHNGFIKYNAKLFDIQKQYELSEYIDEIKSKGAYYILTNAAHEVVEDIFTKEGDYKTKIARASIIGGTNAKRGKFKEFVFSNTVNL